MSSATATPEVAAPPSGELSHRQVMTILSGLLLGMFLAALDQNIVSTAIRTIGDDLHGLNVQAWVTTAFLITSTISTLVYGKLSDIYGRKPLFMVAITIFVTGSALCGLATSMYMLAAFRAFQGLGAGGLFSLALAILADIVSPKDRPKYMGYFMATFATSSVLGPVVGGFLSGQSSIFGIAGWRWIFWVNVPIGIVALTVVAKVLKMPFVRRESRIDWWGAGTIIVGLVPLLIVAEQGREWGWGSGWALACYLVGVLGLVAFVFAERMMGEDALIPLRLFKGRTFSIGATQSTLLGVGMFGGIASIPLYLQIVKGASPTQAGLLILPLVAGIMVSALAAGQITSRTGRYKIFPVIGSIALVAAMLLLTTVGADTTLWITDLYMLLFGVGLGLNMQTIVLAMQNSVPPRDIGVTTSSSTFFRQVGGTLGAAIFLSILFSTAPAKIAAQYKEAATDPAFQAAAQAHPDQVKAIMSGTGSLSDTAFLNHLDSALAHPFLVGFSNAMDLVFLVGAIVLVFAVIVVSFLKEVPLRTMSGAQAARAEEQIAAELASTVAPEDRMAVIDAALQAEEEQLEALAATTGADPGGATHK
ncbi:EmrB/QacA subfamily drug resistance transporter [Jatrophihabitans sp. GAS493]|uniref:MDR family MFS transporter n=1 Tax=Jatrophihabitans sp. GAS493 TaxID=1907575 RepID=UPI000BB82F44|nr:MDR family MFS transporter [Jatrophihabitans sp. GAS493]SOD71639.1 EmrB/QacA subfamily drug resistance transporter [Jatrophihabitans sp. GAS493]